MTEDPKPRKLFACLLSENNYAAYRELWSEKPGLPFLNPHLEGLKLAREGKSGRSAPEEIMDVLRFSGFLECHKLRISTHENLDSVFEKEDDEAEISWTQRPGEALRLLFKLVLSRTCL